MSSAPAVSRMPARTLSVPRACCFTAAAASPPPPRAASLRACARLATRPLAPPGARVVKKHATSLAPRRAHVVVASAAGDDGEPFTSTQEIPIFPLGMCAYPTREVPLNIFEARYRVLFNTLLAGANGLEDDLIDDESPFKGTRAFGMALLDGREMASLGTMLHIEQHERFPDGRMVIVSKGGRRFRVVRVVKQQPVLVCEVQWIDDYPDQMSGDDDFTLDELADEVRSLYRTVVRLSNKVNGLEDDPEDEDALPNKLSPQEASFWYLNEFGKFPATQQRLLELTSTRKRFKEIQEFLRESLSYFGATSALKSALQEIGNKPSSDDAPPQ